MVEATNEFVVEDWVVKNSILIDISAKTKV